MLTLVSTKIIFACNLFEDINLPHLSFWAVRVSLLVRIDSAQALDSRLIALVKQATKAINLCL